MMTCAELYIIGVDMQLVILLCSLQNLGILKLLRDTVKGNTGYM